MWPRDWHVQLLMGTSLHLGSTDAYKLAVAYELYSDSCLNFRDDQFVWDGAPEPAAVQALRAEIAQLNLSQAPEPPPTEDWLLANPLVDGVRRFTSVGNHTQWMKDMTTMQFFKMLSPM